MSQSPLQFVAGWTKGGSGEGNDSSRSARRRAVLGDRQSTYAGRSLWCAARGRGRCASLLAMATGIAAQDPEARWPAMAGALLSMALPCRRKKRTQSPAPDPHTRPNSRGAATSWCCRCAAAQRHWVSSPRMPALPQPRLPARESAASGTSGSLRIRGPSPRRLALVPSPASPRASPRSTPPRARGASSRCSRRRRRRQPAATRACVRRRALRGVRRDQQAVKGAGAVSLRRERPFLRAQTSGFGTAVHRRRRRRSTCCAGAGRDGFSILARTPACIMAAVVGVSWPRTAFPEP